MQNGIIMSVLLEQYVSSAMNLNNKHTIPDYFHQ